MSFGRSVIEMSLNFCVYIQRSSNCVMPTRLAPNAFATRLISREAASGDSNSVFSLATSRWSVKASVNPSRLSSASLSSVKMSLTCQAAFRRA